MGCIAKSDDLNGAFCGTSRVSVIQHWLIFCHVPVRETKVKLFFSNLATFWLLVMHSVILLSWFLCLLVGPTHTHTCESLKDHSCLLCPSPVHGRAGHAPCLSKRWIWNLDMKCSFALFI